MNLYFDRFLSFLRRFFTLPKHKRRHCWFWLGTPSYIISVMRECHYGIADLERRSTMVGEFASAYLGVCRLSSNH